MSGGIPAGGHTLHDPRTVAGRDFAANTRSHYVANKLRCPGRVWLNQVRPWKDRAWWKRGRV